MRSTLHAAALVLAACIAPAAHAEVTVKDPWVRATVAQQKATGAFMKLTASEASRVVGIASPAAGAVEIHEMKMDGGVMKMRAIAGIDLPAGRTVELKPGGHHVMLVDLKQPLAAGATVPLSLTVETAAGVRSTLEVQAQVRTLTGGQAPAAKDGGGHHHHKGH